MKPYFENERMTLWHGDVMDALAAMPAESVHCVVTSPPYWSLRDYGTGKWEGGAADCDHLQGVLVSNKSTLRNDGREHEGPYEGEKAVSTGMPFRDLCGKCGATRIDNQIGLEQSPAEFVDKMVQVFREVRRVLRKDGTCWVNLGDSYVAGPAGHQNGMSNSARSESVKAMLGKGGRYRLDNMRKDTVRGFGVLKAKDLCMMPARVALALQDDGWWLRSEITWCLSGGTRLYARTQKGDMPAMLKDLVRLDPSTVKLWNGEKWTQVTAWTQAPSRESAIELELRSGERVGCTPEHLWPTQRGNVRADEIKVGDVIPTTRLPESDTVKKPQQIPDSLGWFVGFYLAEGHKTDEALCLAIHADEQGYFENWKALAEIYHGSATFTRQAGNAGRILVHGKMVRALMDTYVSGENVYNKHLTNAAWQRSDWFLNQIVAGYLDGDGYWEETSGRWRVGFTNNDSLAADLRTICARLGYTCRLRRVLHQIGEKRYPGWRGHIRVEPSMHPATRQDGEVVAIRLSRARQFWDVSVADEPHLFALASGVLTHNCKRAPMPESVTDRPTSATEKIYLLAKGERYFYDSDAVRDKAVYGELLPTFRGGGAYVNNNSFDNSSALKAQTAGQERPSTQTRNMWNYITHPWTKEDDAWLLSPEAFSQSHFATFPTEIPRRAISAGTSERGCCAECGAPWRRVVEREPSIAHRANWQGVTEQLSKGGPSRPGGFYEGSSQMKGWQPTCNHADAPIVPCTVLDPFGGALTTPLVALRLGRRAVGIDLNSDYLDMGIKRIERDTQANQMHLDLTA